MANRKKKKNVVSVTAIKALSKSLEIHAPVIISEDMHLNLAS